MSVQLSLEGFTPVRTIDLAGVEKYGHGVQVLSGATGFGLPPVQVRWLQGAAPGAQYRGQRELPRVIDLPLLFVGHNRAHLKSLLTQFAQTVSKPCRLWLHDGTDVDWYVDVVRTGGGTYTYSRPDTDGETELRTVVTFTAGDPFWTAQREERIWMEATG